MYVYSSFVVMCLPLEIGWLPIKVSLMYLLDDPRVELLEI